MTQAVSFPKEFTSQTPLHVLLPQAKQQEACAWQNYMK